MSLASFSRGLTPATRVGAGAGVFGLAGASLFAATPALAADFECSAIDGLPTPVLVADGVCEIVITRDDTDEGGAILTFPASMGKIQAVVVGAGGGGASFDPAGNYDYMAYGGGGGQVAFVDEVALDTPIEIIIGQGGSGEYNGDASDGGASIFDDEGIDPVIAAGGYGATEYGGGHLPLYDNVDGGLDYLNYGDWQDFSLDDEIYFALGGGAGTAGSANGVVPGPGFTLSNLVAEFGADADLFPAEADSLEYGMGGKGTLELGEPVLASADEPAASSGHGGNASQAYYDPSLTVGDAYFVGSAETDGADGAIILRYGADELAATGVDATATLAAGAVAAAAGAGLVAITARRRRVTS